MSYKESKKKLDELRHTNDAVFRMAVSHLVDVGIRHLTEENIEETCNKIMQEDDTNHFMTNEFKCELVKMAGQLAQIDHIHLLVYVSTEMYYSVDGVNIGYQRAIQLIQRCIDWITSEVGEEDAYNDLSSGIGFDNKELETLGFGYLLDVIEEE